MGNGEKQTACVIPVVILETLEPNCPITSSTMYTNIIQKQTYQQYIAWGRKRHTRVYWKRWHLNSNIDLNPAEIAVGAWTRGRLLSSPVTTQTSLTRSRQAQAQAWLRRLGREKRNTAEALLRNNSFRTTRLISTPGLETGYLGNRTPLVSQV